MVPVGTYCTGLRDCRLYPESHISPGVMVCMSARGINDGGVCKPQFKEVRSGSGQQGCTLNIVLAISRLHLASLIKVQIAANNITHSVNQSSQKWPKNHLTKAAAYHDQCLQPDESTASLGHA